MDTKNQYQIYHNSLDHATRTNYRFYPSYFITDHFSMHTGTKLKSVRAKRYSCSSLNYHQISLPCSRSFTDTQSSRQGLLTMYVYYFTLSHPSFLLSLDFSSQALVGTFVKFTKKISNRRGTMAIFSIAH